MRQMGSEAGQGMPILRRFVLSALLLAGASCWVGVGGIRAEPERRPTCSLEAGWHGEDPRLLRIYDGLRRGLEHARLPRVCQADLEAKDEAYDAWAKRLEAAPATRQGPVAFALGDAAAERLGRRAPRVPRVLVVPRVMADGKPLRELPRLEGRGTTIVLATRAERVGEVLAGLLGAEGQRVVVPTASAPTAADRKRLAAAGKAGAFEVVDGSAEGAGAPRAVLHLRLGLDVPLLPFARAAALARARGIPLVTDEPARFRQGLATVVLAGEFELAGRHAAEGARRMLARPEAEAPQRRVVRGTRVWIDLGAADRLGLTLPLPFVASADALHRPARAARRAR